MTTFLKYTIISLLILMTSLQVSAGNSSKPSAYASLPSQNIKPINFRSLKTKSNSIKIPLFNSRTLSFPINNKQKNLNNDFSFESKTSDSKGFISATVGKNSIFGQMHYDNKHYIITTEKSGSWIIELPSNGISFNSCGHENNSISGLPPKSNSQKLQNDSTVVDLLVVYNQALADRYPGELMQTRLNQYMNVTNQATANSNLLLTFRLVGLEQIPYEQNNANSVALDDMQSSLAGNPSIPGMQNLKQRREQLGADIVIFMRPHDIETRGSCGQARFPFSSDGVNFDNSLGIHMISDGMSSWSLCTDQVMIHELGHNFGAGHNDVPAQFRYLPDAAGFAKTGQFATVMGSFGTGRPTRLFELDTFSNPNLNCGGVTCGDFGDSNNVNVISQLKGKIEAYQPTVSSLSIQNLTRNNPDKDSDGVSDWDDFFPFDNKETNDQDGDGVGNNSDVFPANVAEQYDFDNDGVGDNQDSDDDDDGVDDIIDAFPFDSSETEDTDNDGVGNSGDLFPNDLTENDDYDLDGIGDNQDSDDDNDSFIDLNNSSQDLLVINTGSNQILRIDAQTGASHGAEVISTDGLLTFQSDLTYRQESQTLFYTSSSGVKRFDLMNRESLGLYIPPYNDDGGIQISSGFPTSLSSINNGENLSISRLQNTDVLVTQGQEKAGFDFTYNWSLIDGDYPIDIITKDGTSYILGKANFLYLSQATSIDFITTSSGVFQSWLADPFAMAANSNNTLYITNQLSNRVGKVNIEDGTVVETFIDLTTLGYSKPTGIVITNDGMLLVAVSDQNAILKFNANTSAFIGELISEKGLNKPHKMILVPKLNDRFHHDIAKVVRPNAGLWYNPETSGRGFDIQVFNNILSVIWYTFDEQGLPTWYISSGALNGFDYTGTFQKTHLNPDASVSIEDAGSINIQFNSERQAQINWTIGTNQGTEAIKWLVWSYDEENNNYTGLWGRPDGPGWGVSVATIGKTSISVPYIYDANGDPRWLISDPVNTGSPLNFNLNAVFSDTLCPSCTGVSSFTTKPAGTMTLDLSADKTWNSSIQFPSPVTGDWSLNDTELKLFSSEATRPR